MRYIQQSARNCWVAVKDDADVSNLVSKIKSADILLADLDETDALPAKELVLSVVKNYEHLYDRRLWHWFVKSVHLFSKKGRGAEEDIARSFTELFLRNPSELERIRKKYTPEYVTATFYQGVRDFYKALAPVCQKFYITRTIADVSEAYASAAGFRGVFAEQFDKKAAAMIVHEFFPERKHYIVRGDSREEENMVTYLRELKQQGSIDDVVHINVVQNHRRINPAADINVSRYNQSGLATLLK